MAERGAKKGKSRQRGTFCLRVKGIIPEGCS